MSEPKGVRRHEAPARFYHWIHAVAFIGLAVTGFVLLGPWTSMSAGEAGQTNRLIHRILGVVLIIAPIVTVFLSKPFVRDVKAGFHWGREDLVTMKVLFTRTYWTGDTKGLPPQGRFMAGQKINIATHVLLWFALSVTGLVLWFGKGALPPWAMSLMILVHALAAIGGICFAIVHIYMVTTLPFTRDAIGAIFSGNMPEEVARSHHPKWHAEVTETDRKVGTTS